MNRGNSQASNLDPRAQRLNKLLDAVLNGRQALGTASSPLFLEAICAQPDAAKWIDRLIVSKTGLSSVQTAMRADLSLSFFNGHASSFIIYLQAPALRIVGGGSFLQQLVIAMVEPPIFWNTFSDAFRAGNLQEKGELSFGWLLLQLVVLPADKAAPYREIAQDQAVLDRLLSSSHSETSAIGRRIKDVVATLHASIPDGSDTFPGDRHDNDFADFRLISIHPTADEITCRELPFLRPASFLDDAETADSRVATYLDNHFRLLREDMIHEMREEMQIALGKKKGKHRGLVIDGLELVGVHFGPDNKRSKWAIALQCKQDLPVLRHKKDRRAFLRDEGRSILRHQSLACLLVNGKIIAFPTILRDEDQLAKLPPVVLLCLTGESSTKKALMELKSATSIKLIQIDTAVFSFEPILKALQEMTSVPLSFELLSWTDDTILADLPGQPTRIVQALRIDPGQDLRSLLDISQPKPIMLDASQSASLMASLTQPVSLIQGPPGMFPASNDV